MLRTYLRRRIKVAGSPPPELAWGVRQFLLGSGSLLHGLVARGDPCFIFQADNSGAFPDQDIDGLASDVAWTPDDHLIVVHADRTNVNSTTWRGEALLTRDTPRVRAFSNGVEIARWGDDEIGPMRPPLPLIPRPHLRGDRISEVESVIKIYAPVLQ